MCASPLPGENGMQEIGVKMNKNTSKNIANIIDCNLKRNDQISIVFGPGIPDTNGHHTTILVPTSPTSVSALPGEIKQNIQGFYSSSIVIFPDF